LVVGVGSDFSAPHSGENRVYRQHMKKYTAAAIRMNETNALIKSPIGNLLPLIVNSIAEKSGFPVIARQRSISASAASKFGMMFRG
jgi:hypothetical protein